MPIIESKNVVDGEEVAIYIEVDNLPATRTSYDDLRDGQAAKVISVARDVFGEAMHLTRSCAKRVVDSVKKMDEATRPEEFELKLAIKLDSEVGAVLARVSAGAQIEVTMKWKPRGQGGRE